MKPMNRSDELGTARTFGRRKGHRLSPRKQKLLDTLLPRLSIDLTTRPLKPLTRIFSTKVEDIALEIGFGAGEHLSAQAGANESWGFIGCEVYVNGVTSMLAQIEEKSLKNVTLHAGDARMLLDWLPDASLQRIFVLFPDPWPKKRHRKRRLINPRTMATFARVMRPGAELRIASDIDDYVRTTLLAYQSVPELEWRATGPENWRERPADWPETRYERKAQREGRSSSYLTFVRR